MYDGRVLELESVEEIKTEAVSGSAPRNSDFSVRSKYPSTASTISIADFLPLVNREFEKYLPNSVYQQKKKNGVTQESNVQSKDSTLKHTSETNLASPPSDNSISHSGENVNTLEKNNSEKSEHSLTDFQYGTKARNTAEEINREKAIALLNRGKDPQYVYQLTGWFRDRYKNLMVDHGGEVYSYGSNEPESSLRLKATNEQLKYENETLVKARKSNEVSVEKMRIAYNQGVADSKELLRKALHSGVDMKANPKYVNTVANEIMGDDIKNSDKAKIKKTGVKHLFF